MAGRTTCMVMPAAGFIIITILLAVSTTVADDSTPIPADGSQVGSWFDNNVKPLAECKGMLDAALVTAEDGLKLIKVMKDGSGNFKTLTDAINSIQERNTKRVVVYIGGGAYNEKIKIPQNKPFVTLYGSPKNMPTLMFDGTAQKYGTVYSEFGARAGWDAQAVALQISGTRNYEQKVDKNPNRCADEYLDEIEDFTEFASRQNPGATRIRCPCRRCNNTLFETIENVGFHLVRNGMIETYSIWNLHGEQVDHASSSNAPRVDNVEPIVDPNDQVMGIIQDAFPFASTNIN
ncbi:hypothetical protein L3X38_038037 [Prunus dulcis]|uniref:pectinesterase n=1 Tax=Prunus dulcis TaxID=3755 RepID=A0AAD4V4I8_PRUDU|nr:hypothetical protein L3X38_038037 [Prunus dulcis]